MFRIRKKDLNMLLIFNFFLIFVFFSEGSSTHDQKQWRPIGHISLLRNFNKISYSWRIYCIIKQRLRDQFLQQWNSDIDDSHNSITLRIFKLNF